MDNCIVIVVRKVMEDGRKGEKVGGKRMGRMRREERLDKGIYARNICDMVKRDQAGMGSNAPDGSSYRETRRAGFSPIHSMRPEDKAFE